MGMRGVTLENISSRSKCVNCDLAVLGDIRRYELVLTDVFPRRTGAVLRSQHVVNGGHFGRERVRSGVIGRYPMQNGLKRVRCSVWRVVSSVLRTSGHLGYGTVTSVTAA